jgi:hypothetical protein
MHRHLALTIGGLIAMGACSQNARVESSGEVAPATPVNRNYIPSGTSMNVRLNESLGTASSHEGDHFTATVPTASRRRTARRRFRPGPWFSATSAECTQPTYQRNRP